MGYDLAGNRTGASMGTAAGISASSATFNSANQMTSVTNGSGPAQFAGSLDKQGTVTIAGNAATMNHFTTNFVGYTTVMNGTNVVPIVATDYGSHSRTNKYQVVITNAVGSQTPLYDLAGNMTNDGAGITYEYDAANRTTAINRGTTNRTEFLYNGVGQRVQIIEKTNGVACVTNKYIWNGMQLLEQRDNTGVTVAKRFFGEGEQISGTNYFFTRDHLGSVREMVNSAGTLQTRYEYDPYGVRARVQGTMDADFGYAGYFMFASQPDHAFTPFRIYRPDLGRWNSRDPLGEAMGFNLYPYVRNNPMVYFDPLGLQNSMPEVRPEDFIQQEEPGFGFGETVYYPRYRIQNGKINFDEEYKPIEIEIMPEPAGNAELLANTLRGIELAEEWRIRARECHLEWEEFQTYYYSLPNHIFPAGEVYYTKLPLPTPPLITIASGGPFPPPLYPIYRNAPSAVVSSTVPGVL